MQSCDFSALSGFRTWALRFGGPNRAAPPKSWGTVGNNVGGALWQSNLQTRAGAPGECSKAFQDVPGRSWMFRFDGGRCDVQNEPNAVTTRRKPWPRHSLEVTNWKRDEFPRPSGTDRVPRRLHFLRVEDEVRALRRWAHPIVAVVADRALDVVGGLRADGRELGGVVAAVDDGVDVHVTGEVLDQLLALSGEDVDHAAGQ